MTAVSDASPLIWLAKAGKINLLKELFEEIVIPIEVYKEAVEEDLKHGFSDAITINECIQQGWIKLSKLTPKDHNLMKRISQQAFEIHPGEAQAIVIAKEMGVLLLMDESAGRAFAQAWGVKVKGTVYVIMSALRAGLLRQTEAKDAVLTMVNKGFRLEPNLLARIIREMERIPPQTK